MPDLVTEQPAAERIELPSLADGLDRSLDPRVIQLHQAIGWIFAGVVGGGSLVVLLLVWLIERSVLAGPGSGSSGS